MHWGKLYSTADCSKLASVEISSLGPQTMHSSKNTLLNSFVPNLTVQTFVSCLPISSGKFAAISCIIFRLVNYLTSLSLLHHIYVPNIFLVVILPSYLNRALITIACSGQAHRASKNTDLY